MKKSQMYVVIIFISLSLCHCSSDKTTGKKILARINNYNLTLDEFDYQLAAELEYDRDFKLTDQAKRTFLEEIVRKELLIQEAKKLKLDRKERFVKSIERYWESTLIRDVLDLKSKEISKKTYVSEKEIEDHYNELKKTDKHIPPFNEIKETIAEELKEIKKSRLLEEWISSLKTNAEIKIFDEHL